jgi:hypothetical protein
LIALWVAACAPRGGEPAAGVTAPEASFAGVHVPGADAPYAACDAGDGSWVVRAAPVLLGRRLHGSAELDAWTRVVGSEGRREAARRMLAQDGAREAWAAWFADQLHAARDGEQDQQQCFGRRALPDQGGALAAFVRDAGPDEVWSGGPFTMADALRDALVLDDVSVLYRLHLFTRVHKPPEIPATDPFIVEPFHRTQLGTSFLGTWLGRDATCLGCHNSEFSVSPTTHALPGLAERAVFGESTGPAELESLTALFAVTDVLADPLDPTAPVVQPWGLSPDCGTFVDPASWPAGEPDWLGQDERFFVRELGPRGSVWDLEASLHVGVESVRGHGPGVGPDGGMDGDEAFAWLVAVHLADEVWGSAVGAPLTIANGFPRNEGQRQILDRLARALMARWSLGDLLAAVTTEPAFNPGLRCGADPYGLPAIYDPWTDSDPEPDRRGNGPGDAIHPLPGRVVLNSVHDALGWPPAPEWALSPSALALQQGVGVYVDDLSPTFVGVDFQTFLVFESTYGGCVYPFRRDHDRDFVDEVALRAQRGGTLGEAVAEVRDRLLADPRVADAERPWIEALAGVPYDTDGAAVPDLEGALRAYCGALLLSPQYWLVTELPPP